MPAAYSRETKVCKEWISSRIDDDIGLSKHMLGMNMRERVDTHPFQIPVNNGWVHGVQDMDTCTDASNLWNFLVSQVNSNLTVKADQCKVVDIREQGDILVSRSIRVPRTDDITIARHQVKFAPRQKRRTGMAHRSGKIHTGGGCGVLGRCPTPYSRCRLRV